VEIDLPLIPTTPALGLQMQKENFLLCLRSFAHIHNHIILGVYFLNTI